MIHTTIIHFTDEEWNHIHKIKKKRQLSWRQIILDWMNNNK